MIGDAIKEVRTLKGLKSYELAEIVGVTRATISSIELNKVATTDKTLKAISKALNVSEEVLTVLGIDFDTKEEKNIRYQVYVNMLRDEIIKDLKSQYEESK